MSFWNLENPEEPWGLFDDDARLPIPIDWSEWLTQEGATYVSHEVEADPIFEVISDTHAAGVITVYLKVADDVTPQYGVKYPFTIRINGTAGSYEPQDERTLWLKIKPR